MVQAEMGAEQNQIINRIERSTDMRNGIITSWEQVPIVMDLPFACRILAKSYDRLKKLSQQGNFPAFKAGSEWRVTKDDLIRYIEENKNTAK